MAATPIYVFGHKSPDNDSVVSATAYAHLKNVTDAGNAYLAARLGEMPAESAALFAEYGVTEPMLAPDDLERAILVDHNEVTQSHPNINDIEVVEIIDHHRIGDVKTANPIFFLNMPVGSTATIVVNRYEHAELDIPKPIAAILLSAVLTDTVLLRSPTTTDADRQVVNNLSRQVGVDPMEFGMRAFQLRAEATPFTPKDALTKDAKVFEVGPRQVLIAQYETVDIESVRPHFAAINGEANRVREENGYDLVVVVLTDIVREGSEIIAVGDLDLACDALGSEELREGPVWMPGVMSRKKQVAAPICARG